MTHGVAIQMRRKFGNPAQLRRQQKKVTEVASLEIADRDMLCLIRKNLANADMHFFFQSDIFQSHQNLKNIFQERKITRLACPRLVNDWDGIKWEKLSGS